MALLTALNKLDRPPLRLWMPPKIAIDTKLAINAYSRAVAPLVHDVKVEIRVRKVVNAFMGLGFPQN